MDPFQDFDTDMTVRKAIEDNSRLPANASSIVTSALARYLAPITEALDTLGKRLDQIEGR